jgi:hypothetical protein
LEKDVDTNNLKAFFEAKEREKHDAKHFEDTKRLGTKEIEILKIVVHLGSRRKESPPSPPLSKKSSFEGYVSRIISSFFL